MNRFIQGEQRTQTTLLPEMFRDPPFMSVNRNDIMPTNGS